MQNILFIFYKSLLYSEGWWNLCVRFNRRIQKKKTTNMVSCKTINAKFFEKYCVNAIDFLIPRLFLNFFNLETQHSIGQKERPLTVSWERYLQPNSIQFNPLTVEKFKMKETIHSIYENRRPQSKSIQFDSIREENVQLSRYRTQFLQIQKSRCLDTRKLPKWWKSINLSIFYICKIAYFFADLYNFSKKFFRFLFWCLWNGNLWLTS